jgi:hypothetical protein
LFLKKGLEGFAFLLFAASLVIAGSNDIIIKSYQSKVIGEPYS